MFGYLNETRGRVCVNTSTCVRVGGGSRDTRVRVSVFVFVFLPVAVV